MQSEMQLKNLFLRQSYMDSWQEYVRWLERGGGWDYVLLTASSETQAKGYRQQIAYRLELGCLSRDCVYEVLPDPDGRRVGSGGATLHVLRYLADQWPEGFEEGIRGKRILVIHSGGDSRRVPQYSVCGKLFSPVPRQLPDGRPSTLFDEFMISLSAAAGRFEEGMLVLSGDVLLLFNPLQLDFQYRGAAAISIKAGVDVGKDHGVYLGDGAGCVKRFLHKHSPQQLRAAGAVNGSGNVDLDTGAVLLDASLLGALYSLISTGGKTDDEKYARFVNDRARLSFYGDFLYPLAGASTLEEYEREAPEGELCPELLSCRRQIWEAVSSFSLKLICLSPAQFIHFGTTGELLSLMTEQLEDYGFLDWSGSVGSSGGGGDYSAYNSIVEPGVRVGKGSYLENSILKGEVRVGEGSILSGVEAGKGEFPEGVVLHGLALEDGRFVTRIYGVRDNPKAGLGQRAGWLGGTLEEVMAFYGIGEEELWEGEDRSLWSARLYPPCARQEESLESALLVYRIFRLREPASGVRRWLSGERLSLQSSFERADVPSLLPRSRSLRRRIRAARFWEALAARESYERAAAAFSDEPLDQEQFQALLERADGAPLDCRIRLYYFLARYLREQKPALAGPEARELEALCFETLGKSLCRESLAEREDSLRICREECRVELPVRVNWGGGWTDTPPYCVENGGVVLNAAIRVRGIDPVQVCVRRLEQPVAEFASEDVGVSGRFTRAEEILDCKNPCDHFALHKAALIACGVVGEGMGDLQERLRGMGGGIYLSTKVAGIPKGSGLGTSSILAGACIRALYRFFGRELTQERLFELVLCMEQIMSTGGGWQDQVGGLVPGVKLIRTGPGLRQAVELEPVRIPGEAMRELQERFALIYTGQRRLARNLLRDVVGSYLCGRRETLEALSGMERLAVLMKFELEKGNIDAFAELLNAHWELSLKLDGGASNTCIDQIFKACEDLIDGRFIAGAGGGGFLQVILKKGVTHRQLDERLYWVFQDCGVGVWECEFV